MKRTVQVEIAGHRLSIKSDEGEEYVGQLAHYVDAHLRELIGNRRGPNLQRAALLVAIQIADELFREKDLHQRFRSQVAQKIEVFEEALTHHESHLDKLAKAEVEAYKAHHERSKKSKSDEA